MLGNIIVAAIVLAIVLMAARKVFKDRKKGGCGCDCSGCPSSGACHPDKR